jgi:type II secretory pathway pseudopilin PulG
MEKRATRRRGGRRAGFTLVELLTVVAIIMLLIGILVPTLSRAREQAKATATRAILRAVGDGLEMFKNENPQECRGGEGYPNSAMRDDPTVADEQWIFGAQWLVRYLMGKTFDGYVPRRNVPRVVLEMGEEFHEENGWYPPKPGETMPGDWLPSESVGPYLDRDRIRTELPVNLEGAPPEGAYPTGTDSETFNTPVILDNFEYPILYYAANTRLQKKMKGSAPVAGYDDAVVDPTASGVYAHADNGLFTGLAGGDPTFAPWDLAGIGDTGFHKLENFGSWTDGLPLQPADFEIPANTYTFPNFILNKDVFESSASVVPYRPDSFLLITPGPDGIYGSDDDVTNFK